MGLIFQIIIWSIKARSMKMLVLEHLVLQINHDLLVTWHPWQSEREDIICRTSNRRQLMAGFIVSNPTDNSRKKNPTDNHASSIAPADIHIT
jgi:hypothetical protein